MPGPGHGPGPGHSPALGPGLGPCPSPGPCINFGRVITLRKSSRAKWKIVGEDLASGKQVADRQCRYTLRGPFRV